MRGPRNAFPFIDVPRYLFVAGGIGITPILPMVKAAQDKDWHLVYCGRSRASMPFLDEIAELDPARVWIRPDTEFGVPVKGFCGTCSTKVVGGDEMRICVSRGHGRIVLDM